MHRRYADHPAILRLSRYIHTYVYICYIIIYDFNFTFKTFPIVWEPHNSHCTFIYNTHVHWYTAIGVDQIIFIVV